MSNNKEITHIHWFRKADNDLLNMKNNLESEEFPTDTLCFHAQQAVEKYLKGALLYFKQKTRKTQDLLELFTQLIPFIPELSIYEDSIIRISNYSVSSRYPLIDSIEEPSFDEAKHGYETALKIKNLILSKIKL